jgi:hypothetical protein
MGNPFGDDNPHDGRDLYHICHLKAPAWLHHFRTVLKRQRFQNTQTVPHTNRITAYPMGNLAPVTFHPCMKRTNAKPESCDRADVTELSPSYNQNKAETE